MKTVATLGLGLLGLLVALLPLVLIATNSGTIFPPASRARNDATFDKIEAKEVVLKSGDGKHSIVLRAFDDGVGVWVTGGRYDSPHVAIFSKGGMGPWVGLNTESGKSRGCSLAFSLDDSNRPVVSVLSGGETHVFDADKIIGK